MVLCALIKLYKRVGNKKTVHLRSIELLQSCCLTPERARELRLPTQLVDKRTRGYLQYSSIRFFTLIQKIESIYSHNLKYENVASYGGQIVPLTEAVVLQSKSVLESLRQCLPNVSELEASDFGSYSGVTRSLLPLLLLKFRKMRAKDFAKVLNQKEAKPEQEALRRKLKSKKLSGKEKAAKREKV